MNDTPEETEAPDYSRTRRYAIQDACGASVMSGAGDAFIIPFAVALEATSLQIGYLSSIVGLLGAFSQVLGSRLVYHFRRRALMLTSVSLQTLVWGFLGLLAVRAGLDPLQHAVLLLILLYSFNAISGAMGAPAWFSLMGDVVPASERGRFFGRRNVWAGIVGMVTSLTAGYTLDLGRSMGAGLLAFAVLFFVAFMGRMFCLSRLRLHADPPHHPPRESYFSFWQFIRRAPSNNFGRFVIYVGLINFGTHFSAPYFTVYMLRDLEFSYLTMTVVNFSAGLFSLASMRLLGRIGDRYGNRKLLKYGSMIIPLPPLLWIFFRHPLLIILTGQLTAGIGWAAFNLATSNYIYDAVTPQRRAICVAYFTMINGIAIFLGALSGGLFSAFVTWGGPSVLHQIFIISALLRIVPMIFLLPRLREVRPEVQPFSLRTSMLQYASIIGPRPLFGLFRGFRGLVFSMLSEQNEGDATRPEKTGEDDDPSTRE